MLGGVRSATLALAAMALSVSLGKCLPVPGCPDGWTTNATLTHGDGMVRCIKAFPYPEVNGGLAECKRQSGNAVSIHSAAENDFITQYAIDGAFTLQESSSAPRYVMIGGMEADSLQWTDGSKFQWSNFAMTLVKPTTKNPPNLFLQINPRVNDVSSPRLGQWTTGHNEDERVDLLICQLLVAARIIVPN